MNIFKNLAVMSIAAIMLIACGDDNGSSAKDDEIDSSSSSEARSSSSSAKSSSSGVKESSSSARSSSSIVKSSSSSSAKSSSSVVKSSSSSVKISSSSEYVPFDHSKTHAAASKVGADAYKQFTDERNGRSYYYITIEGETPGGVDATVTIMAENLNIGTMVNGENDQNDDDVIERYCYNNDTTKCDEFGGLYQWAEMMQLPSRCNTESCADLIENKHRGICPDGWRLMTYRDFYIAWHAKTNKDGIKGTRSTYGFSGTNYTGLSLTGAGARDPENAAFVNIKRAFYWFYPAEFEAQPDMGAYANYVSGSVDNAVTYGSGEYKKAGYSVRCVKVE